MFAQLKQVARRQFAPLKHFVLGLDNGFALRLILVSKRTIGDEVFRAIVLELDRIGASFSGGIDQAVAGNDSAQGRAENRRVDLVVLPRTKIDLSSPTVPLASGPWRKITDDH